MDVNLGYLSELVGTWRWTCTRCSGHSVRPWLFHTRIYTPSSEEKIESGPKQIQMKPKRKQKGGKWGAGLLCRVEHSTRQFARGCFIQGFIDFFTSPMRPRLDYLAYGISRRKIIKISVALWNSSIIGWQRACTPRDSFRSGRTELTLSITSSVCTQSIEILNYSWRVAPNKKHSSKQQMGDAPRREREREGDV